MQLPDLLRQLQPPNLETGQELGRDPQELKFPLEGSHRYPANQFFITSHMPIGDT